MCIAEADDHRFMPRALKLARYGLYTTHPNPRVGCVIVKEGEVVGEGFHLGAGEAHAEVNALRAAGANARDATVYVTLEPCCHHGRTPPCTQTLIAAGVRRLVAAMLDPNPLVAGRGVKALTAAGITVNVGVLQSRAEALNRGFISRNKLGRPWIRVKSAMSLDGRTAMANGESQWITGEAARRDVQFLRAQSSAIMTGVTTVLTDNPSLNVRLGSSELDIGGAVRQPLRIVLDTELKIQPQAKVINLPGDCLIFTASHDRDRRAQLQRAGAEVVTVSRDQTGVDLNEVMGLLGERDTNELHVEAGPLLTGALLEKGLVDELVVYIAPHLMGDVAHGLVHLRGVKTLAQRVELRIQDVRFVGADLKITVVPGV